MSQIQAAVMLVRGGVKSSQPEPHSDVQNLVTSTRRSRHQLSHHHYHDPLGFSKFNLLGTKGVLKGLGIGPLTDLEALQQLPLVVATYNSSIILFQLFLTDQSKQCYTIENEIYNAQ
ncbi:hypothetical protein LWI29_033727 [Acer saccharum]|uniref:Uncharacterized protein n=1 Tax=Acer saccharum TaxID=4024 RepID=A0AA39VB58_ACESA|nr:hypothetical protein LWI29_033727 [Acer saccharum]